MTRSQRLVAASAGARDPWHQAELVARLIERGRRRLPSVVVVGGNEPKPRVYRTGWGHAA